MPRLLHNLRRLPLLLRPLRRRLLLLPRQRRLLLLNLRLLLLHRRRAGAPFGPFNRRVGGRCLVCVVAGARVRSRVDGLRLRLLHLLLAKRDVVPRADRFERWCEGVVVRALPEGDGWRGGVVKVVHDDHAAEEDVAQQEGARRRLHLHHARLIVDHVVVVRERERLPLDGDLDGRLVELPEPLLERLEGRREQPALEGVVRHDEARRPRVQDRLDGDRLVFEVE